MESTPINGLLHWMMRLIYRFYTVFGVNWECKDTAKRAIGKKNGGDPEKIKGVPEHTLNLKVAIGA
jgi:hypothetical protein